MGDKPCERRQGMIRVGLTGGYCTGKTTVTRMFMDLGAPTVNADVIVHGLLSTDGDVIEAVSRTLGKGILNDEGAVDRGKVAQIVFNDKRALSSLTGILYPVVRRKITDWFEERLREQRHPAAIAEVSMLIEGGALSLYDEIVLVLASREVQCERCITRGIPLEEFNRRIANQMPVEEKVRFADHVIDNSGGLDRTREQVLEVWRQLVEKDQEQKSITNPEGS
jgi:dephospho-CoA kinase